MKRCLLRSLTFLPFWSIRCFCRGRYLVLQFFYTLPTASAFKSVFYGYPWTILLTPLSIFASCFCRLLVVFWLVFFACLLIIFSSNPRILLAPGLNVQQKVDKLFAAAHSWPGNTQDRPTTPLDIRINGLEAEKLQCCDFYDICRNDNVLYVCTWESHWSATHSLLWEPQTTGQSMQASFIII